MARAEVGYPTSLGMANGRAWRNWSFENKLFFVVGFCNAHVFSVVLSEANGIDLPKAFLTPGLNMGEIVSELDLFYADGSNGMIPLGYALGYVEKKANGGTPESLVRLASNLRRLASEMDKAGLVVDK